MSDQTVKIDILVNAKQAIQQLSTLENRLNNIRNKNSISGGKQKEFNTFADSYSKIINDMTRKAEDFYMSWQKYGNISDLANYKSLIPQIQQLAKEQESFNRSIKETNGSLNVLGTSFSKHLGWIATGIGVGSAIGGTIAGIHDLANLEVEFNQLKTVIPEVEENQATYNQAMKDSFALAERYGTKVKDVTDSLRLMGRGYHELAESEKLAEIALKLSVADNFNPETSTKAIEAVVGAYGKQADAVSFATHVMDSMTKVSHTGQVSANDLAEALLRSAAAAKTVGISYDELASMIAVIARNTGLSGQTIGDGIKSIANSIHSSKAIESLNEVGISVYKIGANGEKEFRKITDVLLDASIKAKSTNQNFEELFRNLSGGKFQVTKLSSLLGDPNEYLRVLGNSINSSGFTDKQLAIQMDTIQRKAQTLKASFEELLVTGGNESGFRNTLKNILDTLNQILKGLNNINPLVWDTIGNITKFALAFVTLRTAINFATSSYTLLKNTIVTTTVAQEGLNVATMANPLGAVAKLITLAGAALATYAFFAGEAVTAQEKANQETDNAITAKASEIEMVKQQTSYMETLGNTYVSLQQALAQVGDDETKAAEIKKTMGTVSQQLSQIVGQEAADRILASDNIMDAITQEQAVHNEKTTQMQQELDTMRQTQVKLANDTIVMCNERIGAINAEADAFDDAADAIGDALGRIDKFMFQYHRGKANYLRSMADTLDQEREQYTDMPWYSQIGWSQMEGDLSMAGMSDTNTLRQQAAEQDTKADEIKQNAINYYGEKGRKALGQLYTPGSYSTTPISTGEVPEGTPKQKRNSRGNTSNGSRYAPDRQDQIDRLLANHDVNHMLAENKVQAEQYQSALAKLQLQQDLTGETAELDAQKFQLMTNRTIELSKETEVLTRKRDEYQQKANDIIANSQEVQAALNEQKLSWDNLTKDERKDFIYAYFGDASDQKLAISFLDSVDKLTTKIAENQKESSSISNDIARGKKSSPANLYSNKMKDLDYDEQLALYALGPKATDEQKRMIELNSSVLKLQEAERRLQEIKNSDHTVEELKQQETVIAELRNKILDLKDTWKEFGEQAYDALDRILIQGESIGSVFKDLWKQLASSALKALVTGKPVDNSGLLGTVLKLFGHNAEGSIGDKQELTWVRENNKKEAIIPMEGNRERGRSLWIETGKQMGLLNNSAGVIPSLKNPDLIKQATMNIQMQQQQGHVDELIKQTRVLQAMFKFMIENQDTGGTSVAQPVVMQQGMSMDEFMNMYYQAKKFNYIK